MREFKFRIWDKYKKCWLKDSNSLHCFSEYFLGLDGEVNRFDGGIPNDSEDEIFYTRSIETIIDKSSVDLSRPNDFKIIEQKDRFVIQQFTGLKDKNGKDIYEEDIVKVSCFSFADKKKEEESIGEIAYNEEFAAFVFSNSKNIYYVNKNKDSKLKDMKDCPISYFIGSAYISLEILGNVFENPELLNE